MSATASSNPYRAPEADLTLGGAGVTNDLAERGTRLAAAILDNLISMGFMLPGVLLMVLGVDSSGGGAANESLLVAGTIGIVVGFVLWAVITGVLVSQNGWTMGKRVCGIRVVRTSGEPISLGRSIFIRNMPVVLISNIPLIGLVFVLVDVLYIFAEDRRCLHDRIADTIVVRA